MDVGVAVLGQTQVRGPDQLKPDCTVLTVTVFEPNVAKTPPEIPVMPLPNPEVNVFRFCAEASGGKDQPPAAQTSTSRKPHRPSDRRRRAPSRSAIGAPDSARLWGGGGYICGFASSGARSAWSFSLGVLLHGGSSVGCSVGERGRLARSRRPHAWSFVSLHKPRGVSNPVSRTPRTGPIRHPPNCKVRRGVPGERAYPGEDAHCAR